MATTQQSKRVADLNGFWEVCDNPLSKVGVFEYSGRYIHPDLDPNQLYSVYRPAEELSHPDCLSSFRLLPWTNDHPSRLLGTGDGAVKPEEKGIEGVVGEKVYFDDTTQMLRGNIKVFSKSHADRISGGKAELSAGYQCKYVFEPGEWNGKPYQYVQRSIRGNHLSSVDQGRMGPDVSVLDGLNFTIDTMEFRAMKKTYKVRTLMNALIRYAHDAEETPPTEEKEAGEVEQLQGLIKKIAPLMEQLSDLPTIMAKTEMEEETEEDPGTDPLALAAKDAEEEAKKDEDEAKAAKDAEEEEAKKKEDEDKKGEGMDAKEIKKLIVDGIAAALGAVKPAPVMDAKEIMREFSQRDKLANDLSWHVGTFDHSEMTLSEVGKYGCEKLGMKVPAGSEAIALSSYLHNRPVPRPSTGMDRKEGQTSFVSRNTGKE